MRIRIARKVMKAIYEGRHRRTTFLSATRRAASLINEATQSVNKMATPRVVARKGRIASCNLTPPLFIPMIGGPKDCTIVAVDMLRPIYEVAEWPDAISYLNVSTYVPSNVIRHVYRLEWFRLRMLDCDWDYAYYLHQSVPVPYTAFLYTFGGNTFVRRVYTPRIDLRKFILQALAERKNRVKRT